MDVRPKGARFMWDLAAWKPAAATVCVLALATVARAALTAVWGSGYAFIAYYPAVMLSASVGGWKHGLAATFISAVLSVFLFLESVRVDLGDAVALGFFVAANVIVTFLIEGLRRARGRAQIEAIEREAALKQERTMRGRTAQFETLLNEAPLGVYLIDGDFRIRHVNPTARPVFGDISDLIGRDCDEVIHILWPTAYADEVIERSRCRRAATAWSAIFGISPPRCGPVRRFRSPRSAFAPCSRRRPWRFSCATATR